MERQPDGCPVPCRSACLLFRHRCVHVLVPVPRSVCNIPSPAFYCYSLFCVVVWLMGSVGLLPGKMNAHAPIFLNVNGLVCWSVGLISGKTCGEMFIYIVYMLPVCIALQDKDAAIFICVLELCVFYALYFVFVCLFLFSCIFIFLYFIFLYFYIFCFRPAASAAAGARAAREVGTSSGAEAGPRTGVEAGAGRARETKGG